MRKDPYGLTLSTDSTDAANALDRAMTSYLRYRTDTARHLAAALEADPDFALAHVMRGYLAMLSYNKANLPNAIGALAEARKREARMTKRELAHAAALAAWIDGELDRMLSQWEEIFAEHPHDVLAFRMHHFSAFWLGRPDVMCSEIEKLVPRWSSALPGWGMLLSCRSFAHEEVGGYALAERAGRMALDLDPSDVWGAHAVAHVLEMQGRRAEGIAWLRKLEPHWEGANNFKHHLFWHRALFHLERREVDDVLSLYDRGFRNPSSPLTQAVPDLYLDVQNAVSILFRLERLGVAVGDRWNELADKAEARIGDCQSAFSLPHWMMALVANDRIDAARRMIDATRAFGQGPSKLARLIGRVALPVCEAVLENGQGNHATALDHLRPVLGEMYLLGGSHAQQDVLEQLFVDAALKAESADDVGLALERAAGLHPVPPSRRVGHADAAARVAAI